MKITKLLNIAIGLLLGVSSVNAQDIHFSQFFASPLNLNPATTGVLSCDMRFSAIYRNQVLKQDYQLGKTIIGAWALTYGQTKLVLHLSVLCMDL